ncbi:hypothetical protein BDZ45DRAFT_752780 [Acephala macrosclerotiorum]|nr:hypothetical protein BDZ45DRAFT_752780 [Acephala macrosclerotiorum]
MAAGADSIAIPKITFSARGLELDTCLKVFNTEFHVHSVILKMHSAFFFKLWIPPTKLVTTTTAFYKLFLAMYGEIYSFDSVQEPTIITELADYYYALPTLSCSLTAPLYEQTLDILGTYRFLINVAWKLRHVALFQECVVFLAGNWSERGAEEDIANLHPQLQDAVLNARGRIAMKIVKVQEEILRNCEAEFIVRELLSSDSYTQLGEDRTLPMCYRHLRDDKALVVFRFDKSAGASGRAGDRPYGSYFLCAEVPGMGLPWDLAEKDY